MTAWGAVTATLCDGEGEIDYVYSSSCAASRSSSSRRVMGGRVTGMSWRWGGSWEDGARGAGDTDGYRFRHFRVRWFTVNRLCCELCVGGAGKSKSALMVAAYFTTSGHDKSAAPKCMFWFWFCFFCKMVCRMSADTPAATGTTFVRMLTTGATV